MATVTKKKTAKKVTTKAKKALKKVTRNTATSQTRKQVANTKRVARKTAAKASARSHVKPGIKKVAVKKPVAITKSKAKTPIKVAVRKPAPKAKVVSVTKKPTVVAKVPIAKVAANKVPANVVAKPAVKPQLAVPAKKGSFAVGEYVVYPTHGVGKILGCEVEKIGEYELKVFVIAFEKDKMTLRVPVGRAEAAGLRSISADDQITRAIGTLTGRAKIARGMWSRRAQEYEAKINSGNLVQIAEVVRDLHKNVDMSERSYSERMIYETAMHRLCGEVAAFEKVDIKNTQDRLLKMLRKQVADAA